MTSFLRDIQFAFRQLRAHAGFSITAILVLAIGLGASAAIFSVVDAVLLRPLPYPHPETLVSVFESNVISTGQMTHTTV